MLQKNFYKIFSGLLLQLSLSLYILSGLLFKKKLVIFLEYNFYTLNSSELVMVFLIDWMSMIFISIVLMISSVVVLYSSSYMSEDMNKNRFLLLVIFFILSMSLMIISPNMVSILLGWDGLGLISYCLVIYYQNVKSYNAGMLTVMSNRIGDIAILLVISWMLNYGGWNFIFYLELMKSDAYMVLVGSLVILAGMTKSAQIPFSSWLPAAMAAPTPVSALVHSSTLVTAGVYLLIRFSEFLGGSVLFILLMILSTLTMFMSGLGACLEMDLKKVIALSTLSQLGLMMMILSLGYSVLAFFHLLTHAFFKSLLFLCAGVLIHSFCDTQDIRVMGSVSKYMPIVGGFFNFSNLALCGVPFLAGFYSKDLILEMMSLSEVNLLIYVLGYLSTGLTVSYTFRLLYWSFINEFNFNSMVSFHSDSIMNKGMYLLFFFSLVGGSFLSWLIFSSMNFIYLPVYMKYMIIFVTSGGIILGALSSIMHKFSGSLVNKKMFFFAGSMWFMPHISCNSVNFYIFTLGHGMKKNLDFGWLEDSLVFNLKKTLSGMMWQIQKMSLNNLKMYLMIFTGWIGLILMMMVLF
uniref:NADH-ubiquinone oxidoreductase chain 5 n=1 Tax=Lepidostoma longipilosum TaxID=2904889 RepID=A0A9E8LNI2_9NEOP|nr:NADH dehydrogenase subunit 5 [Lepidostoma longipilosum]UZZ43643.1 NADH dehydrogenase subunit 5 [Lepidostoma longipilosum]